MKYEDMTLEDLAHEMQEARQKLDFATRTKANWQNMWDELRKVHIPNKMEDLGMESARIKGVGTISLSADAYCTVPAGNRAQVQQWLAENGFESLITNTVNASTFKAFIKEQIMEGNDTPDDLINFTPYTYAKITGAPK